MELQVLWFALWALLWAVYFMLDGFVLGLGMFFGRLSRSETERRILLRSVGPVWNGNEVWLVTAGGATFAAFPTTYALMFSYLYTALLLMLFSLIVRGVAIEFRAKVDTTAWRTTCDGAIAVASFLPAFLFGVAFGNIFRGLPMDAAGYHGSFLGATGGPPPLAMGSGRGSGLPRGLEVRHAAVRQLSPLAGVGGDPPDRRGGPGGHPVL